MLAAQQQLISIIIPVHNESPNISPLHEELTRHINRLRFKFELIFVDDGSTDDSMQQLEELAKKDHRVRLVEFARNFGKEAAISAGLHAAKGDAAIMMDADLQHPPRLIYKFIAEWKKGADVVVGIKRYDKHEGWFKRWSSARFYQIMQKIAHTQITPHACDYRLIDRKVMDVFSRLTERNRITRGLIDWLGFRRAYVRFEAERRLAGERSYSIHQLFRLAINSFTAYSLVPLKLAGYIGVFILVTATPAMLVVYIEQFVLNDPLGWQVRGTAILALMILMMIGLVLACLGLVSLYIANIHAEVTNRPLYVVRRHIAEMPEDAPVIVLERQEVKQ
ncbi:MAG TPA: glycosyltransferase family 2 protein [Candidatus Saccharimonadales bacterium]|nr:glycosyltransferase family 2 protein [Candidatus Saccharimonadales bacterium]